jgi:restriction system protein
MHDLPRAREMVTSLVDALRELGGTASVADIEQTVARRLNLSPEQLGLPHDKSRSEFQYRLGWTRTYAKKDGLVVSSRRNHWSLAETQTD